MPRSDRYRAQVALLIAVLPFVAEEEEFALKGGTAINLFLRDMPRLSMDIDLAYLRVAERMESLAAIDAAMKRMAGAIRADLRDARVNEVMNTAERTVTKLTVQRPGAQIKIEVTPVLRGCVFAPETRTVSASVEEAFGFAEAQVVSFADLYGGKIMAALDRQHPRDLFDVRDLLAREGITDALRQAFIVYLISHHRPIAEVLCSPQKEIGAAFEGEFAGMASEDVSLEALMEARAALVADIVGRMPKEHRQFLVGFKEGTPDWDLLGVPEARTLPAVRWKQLNLNRLTPEDRQRRVAKLKALLP
ncbi:nucleotidyl transferase AbiEii/AbiGii toxin family protein [Aquabacter sp. P-9]|uniref:nucleotidyl transferase AbiEii/AbiGii toxin family protein n=1 Tax=Aquabacter sediminis TaxID=3029197 RepID=UPI00237EA342|nr:nucleotidyl transferase AbiEii/AbiGii toxin family protein [Aquabacter sp. P-9]MDE1569907.1 nucleotidyl transferase AbiEii/AbiGii toxin family protein [Aquabacter sp. P-9]